MAYNYWTEKSIEFATQRNYLDELFKVYPISPNIRREMPKDQEMRIRDYFEEKDNMNLVRELLKWELFPIKDSYVPFLRKDRTAIDRNPNTVNRIAGLLYSLDIEEMIEKCTEPKESNRQMGPMFKQWIEKKTLGMKIVKDEEAFLSSKEPVIFNVSDEEMRRFAVKHLGYNRDKGLDFLAKINNKFVIAEAKFITAIGGHQNAQFQDAIDTLHTELENPKVKNEIVKLVIADGILYLGGRNKYNKYLKNHPEEVFISALLLREFLYQL